MTTGPDRGSASCVKGRMTQHLHEAAERALLLRGSLTQNSLGPVMQPRRSLEGNCGTQCHCFPSLFTPAAPTAAVFPHRWADSGNSSDLLRGAGVLLGDVPGPHYFPRLVGGSAQAARSWGATPAAAAACPWPPTTLRSLPRR